jgi:hypothetical protein
LHNKLLREPLSIVVVALSRERVGAYRTTHLIHLSMAQAPGLGHAGGGASGGQVVCRPRGVEHHKDVPRAHKRSNLGEMTSRNTSAFRCNRIIADFHLCVNM